MNASTESCGCHGEPARAQTDPAYRRALLTVVVLNLGFGVAELFGGFIADSQALKADSLDFLGDGSISLIGLLALAWSARARAKVALTQGLCLGALGVGVINVVSALVLARFREGDANVRAIWLFSRNDALANVAVIAAAGLVAWTGSAWPDLAVAGLIALLFLHSAYEIVTGARRELGER